MTVQWKSSLSIRCATASRDSSMGSPSRLSIRARLISWPIEPPVSLATLSKACGKE